MKNRLAKLFTTILIICAICLSITACAGGGFTKTTMTNWGEGNIQGGFIGQKGDYVYFINGVGSSTEDNAYGVPVKGSLVVCDKSDMTKSEIVVPKLLVASDYNAGLYIYGDYVYYGTPNTDKDSSGQVANSELTFMRTKLDGTDSTTYFSVSSLSTQYRMVESDDIVYIVYYDATDSALKCFNTSTKSVQTIAKTDATTKGMTSLDAYTFTQAGDQVSVIYTTVVYAEEYLENKAETEGYTRATEDYNEVYAYTVGDGAEEGSDMLGKKILSGKDKATKYVISMVKDGYVYYTQTKNEKQTTHVLALSKLGQSDASVKLDNGAYAVATNVIKEEQNTLYAYTLTENVVKKIPLVGNENMYSQKVAITKDASTLLTIRGEYVYYYNSANAICRVKLNEENAQMQKVTQDSVTTTGWYAPQFITIDQTEYLFYCDASSLGVSYVKYVDVNGEVKSEDTDDDGEVDSYFLEGQQTIGVVTEKDKGAIYSAKVGNIVNEMKDGRLVYERDAEGKLFVQSVLDLRAEYNELSAGVKSNVTESAVKALERYEKAIKYANLYVKLDGIATANFDGEAGKTLKDTYKTAYESIKEEIAKFAESEDYTSINALLEVNMLWNFQKAQKLFAE